MHFEEEELHEYTYTASQIRKIAWQAFGSSIKHTREIMLSGDYRGLRRRAIWVTIRDVINDAKDIIYPQRQLRRH